MSSEGEYRKACVYLCKDILTKLGWHGGSDVEECDDPNEIIITKESHIVSYKKQMALFTLIALFGNHNGYYFSLYSGDNEVRTTFRRNTLCRSSWNDAYLLFLEAERKLNQDYD